MVNDYMLRSKKLIKEPIVNKIDNKLSKAIKESDIQWDIVEENIIDYNGNKFKDIKNYFYNSKSSLPTLSKLLTQNFNLTEDEIKKWYNAQEIVQIFKKPHPKSRIVIGYYNQTIPFKTLEIDILFMPHDGDYKYILSCVDVCTRYKFGKAIKNKKSDTVLNAFKEILKEIKKLGYDDIKQISSDGGSEFKSDFHKFLEDKKIYHFIADPSNHLSMVENLNKFLAEKLFLPLQVEELKTNKDVSIGWVERLQPVLDDLNNVKNSAIKMTPNEAINKKEPIKQKIVKYSKNDQKLKYNLGDKVRRLFNKDEIQHLPSGKISVEKRRATDPIWSREIYFVKSFEKNIKNGIFMHKIGKSIENPKMEKHLYTYYELQKI